MDELLEIFGGEVPEHIIDLHDKVLNLFHKKTNGPLSLEVACLIAVLADEFLSPTKPTKKTEKVTA